MDLQDKVALVTGAASGLGTAVAMELTRAGARVVVADIDVEAGEAVAEAVNGRFVRCDVTTMEDNANAVAFAVEQFGGLDAVHLNAGITTGCGIGEDFDLAKYRRAMGVNLDGVVFGVHASLPALKARGGGAIVATASLAGLTVLPYDPVYAANKHAVVGLARTLGMELIAEGVRVNAVCPGFSESKIIAEIRDGLQASGIPIIPAGRVAETVRTLLEGDMTGECWFVQAGRPADAFAFRGIPGPRAA